MHNAFLIGQRVYLRPLELADAATITGWLNDADVRRAMLRSHPMSVMEEEDFLRKLADTGDVVLGICLRDTGQMIGVTGLHRFDNVSRHVCFGISIGEKTLWGQGLGTEATSLIVDYAFGSLNVNRVWLEVYDFNERGIRIYEKLGFQIEGRQRQHTYREGRYHDVLLMGVLRDEWQARRSQ